MHLSTLSIYNVINSLLQSTQQEIDHQKLLENMPSFAAQQAIVITRNNCGAMMPQSQHFGGHITNQDYLSQTSKTVSKRRIDKQAIEKLLLRQTNKQQKSVQKISSHGKRKNYRSGQFWLQKRGKSSDNTIQKHKFMPIEVVYEDDPEQVKHYRQKTQLRLQQTIQTRRWYKDKHAELMRKTDAFSNTVKSSGFTFGYDGQSLMTASNKQQLKCCKMKVGIKKGKGKLVGGEKLGETIVAKTKIKGKNSGKDVGQVLRPLDIPLFSPRVMTVEVEKDKCKLSDYRKLYGSKYVRLERNWQKEELIGQFDNDQQENDGLLHTNTLQSSTISQKREMILTAKQCPRKMALPKLNGMYKVID